MKHKYLASACILGSFASCALAYDLATDTPSTDWRASTDSRLQMLDARLADKVNELLILGELLSQHIDQAQVMANHDRSTPLLVGRDTDFDVTSPRNSETSETHPAINTLVQTEPSAFKIKRELAPGGLPRWVEYRLSMVVVSDDIHLAVINNQYVRQGDQLTPGVFVTDISAKQVVLSRGHQTLKLTMADK